MSDNQNNNLRNFLISPAEVSIKLKMEENIMKEENNNYSIITNFGCHYTCPYCIVKMNNLGIPETNMKETYDNVKKLYEKGLINFLSYSGGGDPCYLLDNERISFYKSIQELLVGVELEMHTSYIRSRLNREKDLNFSRIVYHCLGKEQIEKIRRINDEIIRVVFVVQDHFTEDYIEEIVEIVKRSDIITELSFRQRLDENYETTYTLHNYLKDGHKKDFYYIEQDDYNNYIVNDQVYKNYSDFKQD